MPSNAQDSVARELFSLYEQFKENDIVSRRFTQAQLVSWLQPLDSVIVRRTDVDRSGEGRPITMYTVGHGPKRVFLWSQMHGDEPTATMALVDLMRFMVNHRNHRVAKAIDEGLTVLMVPMINPDGAQRFTRRTGQMIDMNRDAVALVTPEARLLKRLQTEYRPEYGFNLHDQDRRYTVGMSGKGTAFALLAPPTNDGKADNEIRLRAKRVASVVAATLSEFIPGRIAKWDDTFESRAFGDSFQKWGTSTVLIESGGWADDPEKMFLRKLNCVALLTTLSAIATGETDGAGTKIYEEIPFNTKFMFDVLVRRASLKSSPDASAVTVDLGINIDDVRDESTGETIRRATIMDVGDLSMYDAFRVIDGTGKTLQPSKIRMDATFPADELSALFGN